MNINILEGIRRGRNFFNLVGNLGKYLLYALGIFSLSVFWTYIYIIYEPFREGALLMIKTVQLGFIMLAAGYLFALFLDFVYEHFYNKEIKAYQIKESENVRIKPRKRK
jgi:magnesium-transporting ATPase (P-type)